MSVNQEGDIKLFEYIDIWRNAGRMRAVVFIFFSVVFAIPGILEWQNTGIPATFFYSFPQDGSPTPFSVFVLVAFYGLLTLTGIVGICFLLTTHPSVEISQKGIRIYTFLMVSPWLSFETIRTIEFPPLFPSARDKLLIEIEGLKWPFLMNGFWYKRRWCRLVVINKDIMCYRKLIAILDKTVSKRTEQIPALTD